jgi:AraC-like DNA-binding protein
MSLEATIVTLVFACCATVHFVGMFVVGILARHRVQYLSLAWILAIFFGIIGIVAMYGDVVVSGRPGLLNPYMLLMLVVGTYLQSIYSLGIAMPGFLQWSRMCKYASPVFLLAAVYVVAIFPAGQLTKVYSLDELFHNIFSLDLILRCIALLLGAFYLVNIIFLPRHLAQKTVLPLSLIAYTVLLILSVVMYLYTALNYTPFLLCGYVVLFTLVNFYWVCHAMSTLIVRIPHPEVMLSTVEDGEPMVVAGQERADESRETDFNEMNLKRYQRVQAWMQKNKDSWTNNGFTRDRLCDETGINRQLMLQCLRSQGHNNIHDYITTYRVEEMKRLILAGRIKAVADCDMVGFGTPKTARSCFERIEGENLDSFIASRSKSKSADTDKVL